MNEWDKVLTKLVPRLEKVGRRQEVGVVMMHLMVLQLDGEVEISKETMLFYRDALQEGSIKKVEAFRNHCAERYFT